MECLLLKAITPIYLGAEMCVIVNPRRAGHWLTLILHLQSLIPRAGTWDEFGPSITIYTWHAQGQDGENFCYLLWKTTEGDNEAFSEHTGRNNVIFAAGFIPHFWVLLFSCRLKASNNPVT